MNRVCIYDAAEDGILGWAWAKGTVLGNFDQVIAAHTWAEAFAALASLPERSVGALQVWGHGSSGRPLIGGRPPGIFGLIDAVAPCVGPASRLWFRSCNVFQGPAGQDFARNLGTGIRCTVVGHTRVVSGAKVFGETVPVPWQSGGYALRPGERPHWPSDDAGGSGPFERNTCLATRMTVPDGWFQ